MLKGGKASDTLIADAGNDTMYGQADGDDFVFGHMVDVNRDGDCDDEEDITNTVIGNNVIKDFDQQQGDQVVFGTAFEGTLSAEIIGNDVKVSSWLGGSVLIEGLVDDLEGINPSDPFFDAGALMEFLLKTGEDGDGKGIISFEDVCVTLPDCAPDSPETGWEAEFAMPEDCCRPLDTTNIGDTTINTTELEIATYYVEQDENVSIRDGQLCIDLLSEGNTA